MSRIRFSLLALLLVPLLLPFADLEIISADPGGEFGRIAAGFVQPNFLDWQEILKAAGLTFAFGMLGTLVAAPFGMLMAIFWHWQPVRIFAASIRAIHELFWALLFLHVFGLTPLTGLLAIAIPFSGIFAKVFAEILSEQPDDAVRHLPPGTSAASVWLCVRLPQAWPQLRSYFFSRAECGMRSSAVLGFVGLPTLGYHLEAALSYGAYSDAAAFLLGLILVIGAFRWIVPPRSWLIWLAVLPFFIPGEWGVETTTLVRLLQEDLWPVALLNQNWPALGIWFTDLLTQSLLPGLWQTILLSVLALVATGVLTLLIWPLAIRQVAGLPGQGSGHFGFLIFRATPEYLLAYLFLLLWGPSMLPAIVALMLHNAGIIAFLLARMADRLPRRADAATGLRYYFWEALPRLFGPFLAYLFYRWEIILRESSVVGILGIATLGFYVDSALAELRLDRLLPLLLGTVLLNVFVDISSRRLRKYLSLDEQRNSHAQAAAESM